MELKFADQCGMVFQYIRKRFLMFIVYPIMEEDFSEFNNHTLKEVNLIHTESCELLINFVEEHFYIKKGDQSLKVIDENEGVVMILSYKLGDRKREVGRVINKFGEDSCCILIKNFCKNRFIEFLVTSEVGWSELKLK